MIRTSPTIRTIQTPGTTEARGPRHAASAAFAAALMASLLALETSAALAADGVAATKPAPGTVGSPMPAVELPTVGGPPLDAQRLAGKVVLYEFWATWCTPCHVQVEILKALQPSASAAGVELVGIATGEPGELVAAHLAKHPSPYPVLLDQDEKLGMALEVLALPTLVVVDREGKIVWRDTGITNRETLVEVFARAGAPLPSGGDDVPATAATPPPGAVPAR